MEDKSITPSKSGRAPECDAEAQFEKRHKGAKNDGVVSADPRVISGKKDGDATFPIKKDK
ncbi:hypothetical protein EN836_27915 [Mesorhizobium sp. M1C.F.Ca.ET.193.01.1.1]|nr:hypothetical protein [Mesorhizobium sp. M1C.F.Ca.ET.212.01.1.1]TGQ50714.1 hypothetical protein EN853_27910 [Mesorhizobium sp. M1C.F.Ca.ET.210.01.1.1]TGQ99885.1 hypothetical protein EN847_27910 [Mesorhizobium sp. M1C.F.Ca.ET.204.01.1.1]TGR20419.1 hypothetical protein EN839_27910 [Mesorhizobium sp. M1C.F.Ca.ET.196.01.1.1]TGR43093.1 hypothetical protein EN838_27910 [Mesorhizobium sp. M1C.F.Ca.ET.195.01.1.1]TGR61677.1 hypothetical protein EN835_027905 [Mesorhizobium sp. M1C.F.Ca.ET.192.01.1.1]